MNEQEILEALKGNTELQPTLQIIESKFTLTLPTVEQKEILEFIDKLPRYMFVDSVKNEEGQFTLSGQLLTVNNES